MTFKLTKKHIRIFEGRICPYCEEETVHVSNHNNTGFIVCINYPKCDSTTNAIPGTTRAEGRLASVALRRARGHTKYALNKIIQGKYISKEELDIEVMNFMTTPELYSKIHHMNIISCEKVETWAIKRYNQYQYDETKVFIMPMATLNRSRKACTIIRRENDKMSLVEFNCGIRKLVATSSIYINKPKYKKNQ